MAVNTSNTPGQHESPSSPLPRVTIRFCTQCKWMLRAAYFAQELLSTFSTSLGEVALQPTTGGIFVVEIYYYANPDSSSSSSSSYSSSTSTETETTTHPNPTIQQRVLWDRKTDGGFPETKELKRRVRDVIEPGRNLGHVDRDYPRPPPEPEAEAAMPEAEQPKPLGPRWPQLNNNNNNNNNTSSGSSQAATPQQLKEQSTDTPPQTNDSPQSRKPIRHPFAQRNREGEAGGPVYDPHMPGGIIMPLAPPVAPGPRYIIQESRPKTSTTPQSQTQHVDGKEECEDCQ